MNIYREVAGRVQAAVEALQADGLTCEAGVAGRIQASPPRESGHGDVASNAALMLARGAGMKPRDLARRIAERLGEDEDIAGVEIGGPGFVNIRLSGDFWRARLRALLRDGPGGLLPDIGLGRAANVEYVSANPTGPPHVGTARGAVYGDVLASLLDAVGYRVTREYYVNDGGAQVDNLAWSAYLRYRQALGDSVAWQDCEDLYPGDYLVAVGEALAARHGTGLRAAAGDAAPGAGPLPEALESVRDFAVQAMMKVVRDDLALAGIRQDVFVSERAMVTSGGIEACLEKLEGKGLLYTGVLAPPKGREVEDRERVPQTLFRSTAFGDDLDRPVRKSDGTWSYFAPDIAYHNSKVERGFDVMINVFGADHAGYVRRLKAAVAALSDGKADFTVLLTQLVHLYDDGVPVRMSKRSGRFVTLRNVVETVGKDVLRFMMVTRRPDAPLDFDLVRVQEQSRDNPVFYVHYAHARACSVLRHASEAGVDTAALVGAELDLLVHDSEIDLVRVLSRWPGVVETAAEAREPHRIATYLCELAAEFHGLWNRGREDVRLRFLVDDNKPLSRARVAMVDAVRQVIAAGLDLFGVDPREEMR